MGNSGFKNKFLNGFEKYISNPLHKFYDFMTFRSVKHFDDAKHAYENRPKFYIYTIILILVILGFTIYASLDIDFFGNISYSPSNVKMIINGFLNPDWSLFFGYGDFSFKESTIYQIIETLGIAFVGTSISSLISLPFGYFASKKMVGRSSVISEVILICIRTFPELLFGLICIKVVGFGAFTGVVVLSVHSIGMIGKMFSEQLDAVDVMPLEALDACGASRIVKLKNGVLPEVAPGFLSVVLYRFDLNVRTASLLGVVGAGGIGYSLWLYSSFNLWRQEAAMIYGIIIMVVCIDLISGYLRKKLL